MFELKRPISRNSKIDLEDTAKIKFALTSLGRYDDTETGLSPYADDRLFRSIQSFQKENNLKVDGVINPEGETHTKIKEKLATDEKSGNAFGDFWKNYMDMREADTIDADKYFHCKANYEATKRGWEGFAAAVSVSNLREAVDLIVDSPGDGVVPTVKDVMKDQRANKYGRDSSRFSGYTSAREACAIFRPKGLNEKY